MKFFKAEDFEGKQCDSIFNAFERMSEIANTKLEKEGLTVYGTKVFQDREITKWFTEKQIDSIHGVNWSTHRGLLINVEPIEKCNHPKEKVRYVDLTIGTFAECRACFVWKCECGKVVEPELFTERIESGQK